MEKNEISIKEWIENFKLGKYSSPDRDTQIKAGWYDWFCRDTSLRNKTYKMGKIIEKITNKWILENCYIFFKNNCPVLGPLYDSFRIVNIKIDNDYRVLYTINIGDKRENHTYTIYGRENDFDKPLVSSNYQKDIIKFINNLERGD